MDDVLSVENITFFIASTICLAGALGVVVFRNPVHNALSLVATLFGVAVLFIAQEAYFLAAMQVIVYAGALVVLFLFVIMLLGVDKVIEVVKERSNAVIGSALAVGIGVTGLVIAVTMAGSDSLTGAVSNSGSLNAEVDVEVIGEALFTDYVFAFEITSLLLTVAVVGAVVLARKERRSIIDLDEFDPIPVDEPDEDDLEPDGEHEVSDEVSGETPSDEAPPEETPSEKTQPDEAVTADQAGDA